MARNLAGGGKLILEFLLGVSVFICSLLFCHVTGDSSGLRRHWVVGAATPVALMVRGQHGAGNALFKKPFSNIRWI